MPSRHHDIADRLRRQITTGRIQPGERLPSETDLADRYNVSTLTLRSALAALQGEGLVEKIHGKGNFARRPLRKIMYVGGWGTLDPWTATEAALRVTVRTTAVPAHGHLTALLNVPMGSPVVEVSCVSFEEASPHGLARIYIPRDLVPAGVLDDESAYGEEIKRFAILGLRQLPSARRCAPVQRHRTKHRPFGSAPPGLLAITRTATDSAGRVVEAALLAFPGDRIDAVFTTHHVIDER